MSSSQKLVGKKGSTSSIGAPSQRLQNSRKGKRAWRKNIDIHDVEEGLEDRRQEERVVGSALRDRPDDDLFTLDPGGDTKIRSAISQKHGRRPLLTASKILAQRSAVPPVFSRTVSVESPHEKRKRQMAALGNTSRVERIRMLKTSRRLVKGPLNSYIDPSDPDAETSRIELSETIRACGQYDPWKGGQAMKSKIAKKPVILTPAVVAPHLGTSYNPPDTAHQELILKAHAMEEKKVAEELKLNGVKEKIALAERERGGIEGMVLDTPSDGYDEDAELAQEEMETIVRKTPARKTKKDKKKAQRIKEEKRAAALKAARRHLLSSINPVTLKSLRKAPPKGSTASQDRKIAADLAGTRIGRHRIPETAIDVQLGEELSESFRQLKPEGNLFKDRFVSMQQRGVLEPRVPVLPKKRRHKIVEYEKHAWKKFE